MSDYLYVFSRFMHSFSFLWLFCLCGGGERLEVWLTLNLSLAGDHIRAEQVLDVEREVPAEEGLGGRDGEEAGQQLGGEPRLQRQQRPCSTANIRIGKYMLF